MKINFLGDVFLDEKYKIDIPLDNFIFNLECPLSKSGIPALNKINLGVENPNILETFNSFPKVVNLANNHIMDYGEEAFSETVNYLDENNISYFGAGNKNNNYNNPYIFDFKKNRIALMGYSCPSTHAVFGGEKDNGSALLNLANIIKDIENSKENSDFIVVSLHWGDEEIKYPKFSDIEIAHQIIDAGADLIVGHHAHVIQTFEIYKSKYIFYGIGNFIFPDFSVESYFDGKIFQSQSSKIQQKQNKESIIINLDINLKITYNTVVFENGTIKNCNCNIPKWLPKSQKSYNIYYRYVKRLGTIMRFVKNPKIPTIKQLKIFLGFK